jgi:DNA-directed RNA polymerase specialized sigma24 family protein
MSATMSTEPPAMKTLLGDPALRRALSDFVRRRVPPSDVDDVVQTVLVDALAATNAPADPRELTRWMLGVARHKVADLHRRAHREPPAELPDLEAAPAPIEEIEMARWAEEQAGSSRDARQTLAWMAREGEGEKLEAIATDEQVPAARVRQRVSRMRRWMKERWLAELAAVAALGVVAVVAWWVLTRADGPVAHPVPAPSAPILPEPPDSIDRARSLRADALEKCKREDWAGCLEGLDQARGLDPVGDQAPEIGAARSQASDGLKQNNVAPDATTPPKGLVPAPKPSPSGATAPAPSTPSTPSTGLTNLDSDGPGIAKGTIGTGTGTGSGSGFSKKSGKVAIPVKPTGKSKPMPSDFDGKK